MSRIEMSGLLLSLTGNFDRKPLHILQDAWTKYHQDEVQRGATLPAFLTTDVPPILQKILKGRQVKGFSLSDIAALGRLIEYSTLTVSTMQNWVKRDFKDYLGAPRQGKKYSVNQAALLFIIDDLKAALDFESIRQLFRMIFLKPDIEEDDLVEPAQLYNGYSALFEEIKQSPLLQVQAMTARSTPKDYCLKREGAIRGAIEKLMNRLSHLTRQQKEAVKNMLMISAISVQTCYYQSVARQYVNAALFLDF
ncbi:DUF1836 domain-containing protein [Paenibacillus sp. PK3_47]|uniref:DUF1836 domain-containing protein n=1 Tax=Paenibacillus sp. PK3_47 TaxID=2072642 RepID=UPI00201E3347|nr:DUF1836 domain-containing protein [Paenibacillus sp. PK3_47]